MEINLDTILIDPETDLPFDKAGVPMTLRHALTIAVNSRARGPGAEAGYSLEEIRSRGKLLKKLKTFASKQNFTTDEAIEMRNLALKNIAIPAILIQIDNLIEGYSDNAAQER